MKIKSILTENVVMTDEGLLKRCTVCCRYLPLEEFHKDERRIFRRKDICKTCVEELRHPLIEAEGRDSVTNARESREER